MFLCQNSSKMLVWVPSVTKFDLFWTHVSLNWTCSPDLLCLSSDSESNYTNIVVFMMPSAPTSFKCGVCNPYWGLLRHRCYIMSWCLLCFMQSTLSCLVVKTCYTSERLVLSWCGCLPLLFCNHSPQEKPQWQQLNNCKIQWDLSVDLQLNHHSVNSFEKRLEANRFFFLYTPTSSR